MQCTSSLSESEGSAQLHIFILSSVECTLHTNVSNPESEGEWTLYLDYIARLQLE
jgi:hypothetical protein